MTKTNEELNELIQQHILIDGQMKDLKLQLDKIKAEEKLCLEVMGEDLYLDPTGNKVWFNNHTRPNLDKKALREAMIKTLVEKTSMTKEEAEKFVDQMIADATRQTAVNSFRLDTAKNIQKFQEGKNNEQG